MASKFSSVGLAGWLLLVSLLLGAALSVKGAVSCGSVVSALSPCISYLRSGGTVPSQCCKGVKNVNGAAKTTPDRQAACGCLKSASTSIAGLDPSRIKGLPAACGVSIPYAISPSTDCSKVK